MGKLSEDEPEITTMGEKGQVVIPQLLRKHLNIKPRTKFLVFGRGDTVIMKRLELPNVKKEWEDIFKTMDQKKLKISESEILEEIREDRKARRKSSKR